MGSLRSVLNLSLLAGFAAFVVPVVVHFLTVFGPFLVPKPTVLGEGQGPIYIQDTVHCEDVHHYLPANLLFTACEDVKETRFKWFPGLGHYLEPQPPARGSIHVVDPTTFESKRLEFENFESSFVTHGIDVIGDPQKADAVYIFAVNHLTNPEYFGTSEPPKGTPKARSQIELFHHVLGSNSVKHIRSIRHELITTPNDVYAISPSEFYVTNDHFYREGLMRMLEDTVYMAKWSNIIHVQITDSKAKDATAGLEVSVAHAGLHNNNGLGHGRTANEMSYISPTGRPQTTPLSISIHTTLAFKSATDNPSYYTDPYRTDADDASGIVIAGTTKDPNALDPLKVWYARLGNKGWEQKLLFEDDGSRIRSASAAVLVPIAPENGKKLAWLFVTGFMSESMVAVQVEL
ncbi:hypothetical protein N7468_009028 [Penicillium chermesinum]|uniref:Serum paraoxonase/arylesterase family protein n=1 Tax=Penicillium chermesinum TaxID=63820 RepID=A0A9W9NH09_9EURO|nr:uncharacterized protein N7468_009028 [Penicillium chermesinum]KAJ5219824.1 hypothetical protein N7468_009028 [Penicillium chermesinum]